MSGIALLGSTSRASTRLRGTFHDLESKQAPLSHCVAPRIFYVLETVYLPVRFPAKSGREAQEAGDMAGELRRLSGRKPANNPTNRAWTPWLHHSRRAHHGYCISLYMANLPPEYGFLIVCHLLPDILFNFIHSPCRLTQCYLDQHDARPDCLCHQRHWHGRRGSRPPTP